jgi:hypothetical protein
VGELVVEVLTPEGEWRSVNSLRMEDPPGSLSSVTPEGREIYVFACQGGSSVLLRSTAGLDFADAFMRDILVSGDLEPVAEMLPGDSHRIAICTDISGGETRTVRFTHIGG